MAGRDLSLPLRKMSHSASYLSIACFLVMWANAFFLNFSSLSPVVPSVFGKYEILTNNNLALLTQNFLRFHASKEKGCCYGLVVHQQLQCSGYFASGTCLRLATALYRTPIPLSPNPKFPCWRGYSWRTQKWCLWFLFSPSTLSACFLIRTLLCSYSIFTSSVHFPLHFSISGFINTHAVSDCLMPSAVVCFLKWKHVQSCCIFLSRMQSVPMLTGAGPLAAGVSSTALLLLLMVFHGFLQIV